MNAFPAFSIFAAISGFTFSFAIDSIKYDNEIDNRLKLLKAGAYVSLFMLFYILIGFLFCLYKLKNYPQLLIILLLAISIIVGLIYYFINVLKNIDNPEKLKDYSVNIRNLSIALSIVYIVFWCMIWLRNVLHKNNNKFLQLKEIIRNN
jgi:prepilin signal peptidase PulO-like enzyme (type II secretory pathway)